MQLDYDALAALAAILRTGSFDGAAAELGLTQPAISLRIKTLEDRVGAILVRRGRPCTATPTGARLNRHAEEVGLLEKTLTADLGGLLPDRDRPLRLAINADSLATWVLPALAEVEGFRYDITVDDQDHSADWLRRGEVSAAITAHGAPIPGCDATPLGALGYAATCAPGFAARWFAQGVTPEALNHAPCLAFDRKDRLQHAWVASALGLRVALPLHYLPTAQGFVEAAMMGLGWGMNPVAIAAPLLADGRLVELIPDHRISTLLYWQVSRQTAAALDPLTKGLRRAARKILEEPGMT